MQQSWHTDPHYNSQTWYILVHSDTFMVLHKKHVEYIHDTNSNDTYLVHALCDTNRYGINRHGTNMHIYRVITGTALSRHGG